MKIVYLGNPLLREHSVEVTEFDSEFRKFVDKLSKTTYDENGVGPEWVCSNGFLLLTTVTVSE